MLLRSSGSLRRDRTSIRCCSEGFGTVSTPRRQLVRRRPSFAGSVAIQNPWLTFDSGIAAALRVASQLRCLSSLPDGWRRFASALSGIRSYWRVSSSMSALFCARNTFRVPGPRHLRRVEDHKEDIAPARQGAMETTATC